MIEIDASPDPHLGEDEEVVEVAEAELVSDPLYKCLIRKHFPQGIFIGRVAGVDVGVVSKEKLYRIEYADGDQEHLSADAVRACRMLDEDAEGEEDMHSDISSPKATPMKRRPSS